MKKIVFINEKGGVGKTSCCFNSAWEISKKKKILLIDLDGQGANLTFFCGIKKDDPRMLSTYDVLEKGIDIREAIKKVKDNLYIVPGTDDTKNLSQGARISKFKQQLETLDNDCEIKFDYVFIDVNPTPTRAHALSLGVADYVVIPMAGDVAAVEGEKGITESIEQIKEEVNHNLKVLGIVFNKFDPRTNLSKEVYNKTEMYAQRLESKIFDATIRNAVVLSECVAYHIGVTEYAPGAPAAEDVIRFSKEIEKEVAING